MSINYVIATYNGKTKRMHKEPMPENILVSHLEKIYSLQHNLNQITIIKAKSDNYYINYYNLDNIINQFKIPIVIIECENYGYSMGQWLKAYEIFKSDFDYYIFVEDDYCPGMHSFDNILITCYKEKFSNNIGLLCSLVEGSNHNTGGYPIHFEGGIFISKQTLELLYSNILFENNPIKYLDLLKHYKSLQTETNFNWGNQKASYIGGYYQLTFSYLFTLTGIKHEDYLDISYNKNNLNLQFPYWSDEDNEIGGKIVFYDKGDIIRNRYTLEDIYNSPIIPIQLKDTNSIIVNTNLKI